VLNPKKGAATPYMEHRDDYDRDCRKILRKFITN